MRFIKDLLSPQEAEMLAKRIKIAQQLLDGQDYGSIQRMLKVSTGTIARINEWLKYSGDGYRLMIERLKKKNKNSGVRKSTSSPWDDLKRRYPIMFWPQLVLEEFVAETSVKKKEKLRRIINQ